ncbi:MAG: hypothetical protein SPK06_00035 [Kiritimatiellia bacterium]|nr:hypothetical protein [Kiritimatiellia bacterium]
MDNPQVPPQTPFGLALHNAPEEEFPVLKAFQGYLEAEREKARRKLILLTAFFGSLFLLTIFLFGCAFLVLARNASDDTYDIQARLIDLLDTQARTLAAQQNPTQPQPTPTPPPQPLVITQTIIRVETLPPPKAPETKPQPAPVPPKPALKPAPKKSPNATIPPAPPATAHAEFPLKTKAGNTLPWRFYIQE